MAKGRQQFVEGELPAQFDAKDFALSIPSLLLVLFLLAKLGEPNLSLGVLFGAGELTEQNAPVVAAIVVIVLEIALSLLLVYLFFIPTFISREAHRIVYVVGFVLAIIFKPSALRLDLDVWRAYPWLVLLMLALLLFYVFDPILQWAGFLLGAPSLLLFLSVAAPTFTGLWKLSQDICRIERAAGQEKAKILQKHEVFFERFKRVAHVGIILFFAIFFVGVHLFGKSGGLSAIWAILVACAYELWVVFAPFLKTQPAASA